MSKAVQPEAAEETRERGSRRSSSLCTRAGERVHIAGGQAQTAHTIKACYPAPSKKPRPRSLLTRLHISTTTSHSPFTLSQIWPPAEPPTSLPMFSLVRHRISFVRLSSRADRACLCLRKAAADHEHPSLVAKSDSPLSLHPLSYHLYL